MNEIGSLNQIVNDERIRKEWHEGEWYFSTIDVLAVLMDSDLHQAINNYHVIKNRLKKNKRSLPYLKQFKGRTRDGKLRLTDFTNSAGVEFICQHVAPNIQRRKDRIKVAERDEVLLFHPKVMTYLESGGWEVQHHYRLQSEHTIDLVATKPARTLVIECKPELGRGQVLFNAIGQILCYRNEYDYQSVPAIASYSQTVSDYARISCHNLGIEIIEINDV